MSKSLQIILCAFIIWTALMLQHMHEDITAMQFSMQLLDESGKLLPEYKPGWR